MGDKKILAILGASLAAVIIWALIAKAFTNGTVFILACIGAGLIGYSIANYLFGLQKKIGDAKRAQLAEELKTLRTLQSTTTSPNGATASVEVHKTVAENAREVLALQQQLKVMSEEHEQVKSSHQTQTAQFSMLKTRYEKLLAQYQQTQVDNEALNTEYHALQDTLAQNKVRILELSEKNMELHKQIPTSTLEKIVESVEKDLPTPTNF